MCAYIPRTLGHSYSCLHSTSPKLSDRSLCRCLPPLSSIWLRSSVFGLQSSVFGLVVAFMFILSTYEYGWHYVPHGEKSKAGAKEQKTAANVNLKYTDRRMVIRIYIYTIYIHLNLHLSE